MESLPLIMSKHGWGKNQDVWQSWHETGRVIVGFPQKKKPHSEAVRLLNDKRWSILQGRNWDTGGLLLRILTLNNYLKWGPIAPIWGWGPISRETQLQGCAFVSNWLDTRGNTAPSDWESSFDQMWRLGCTFLFFSFLFFSYLGHWIVDQQIKRGHRDRYNSHFNICVEVFSSPAAF